jgi:hypothetical protein
VGPTGYAPGERFHPGPVLPTRQCPLGQHGFVMQSLGRQRMFARRPGILGGLTLHSCPMSRSSGIGAAVAGIVVAVVGAIMRLATTVHSKGFNIHKVGDVLLVVGVLLVVFGLIAVATSARGRTRSRA